VAVAYIVTFVLKRTFGALARKTETTVDDDIIVALDRPLFLTALCLGLFGAIEAAEVGALPAKLARQVLETLLVLSWTGGLLRTFSVVLASWSRHARQGAIVQPRTLPLFDMLAKILVIGGAVYFIHLVWELNLTGWLASAGVVGIAVGFAAKDSLANFISGIFILADAPYKIGDWVVLDSDMRGMVTAIGIRSTRILTRDDIEITVPNAVIGNSKIINEAGGRDVRHRIGVVVEAAYGSDIDVVYETLLGVPEGVRFVCDDPAPMVVFKEFGASGLVHVLYVWIHESLRRERVISDLNTRIYKAFAAADIEIPYSKHDVYIKEMPAAAGAGAADRGARSVA